MQSETTERRRDSDNGKRSVSGGRRFDKDLRESPFGSTAKLSMDNLVNGMKRISIDFWMVIHCHNGFSVS